MRNLYRPRLRNPEQRGFLASFFNDEYAKAPKEPTDKGKKNDLESLRWISMFAEAGNPLLDALEPDYVRGEEKFPRDKKQALNEYWKLFLYQSIDSKKAEELTWRTQEDFSLKECLGLYFNYDMLLETNEEEYNKNPKTGRAPYASGIYKFNSPIIRSLRTKLLAFLALEERTKQRIIDRYYEQLKNKQNPTIQAQNDEDKRFLSDLNYLYSHDFKDSHGHQYSKQAHYLAATILSSIPSKEFSFEAALSRHWTKGQVELFAQDTIEAAFLILHKIKKDAAYGWEEDDKGPKTYQVQSFIFITLEENLYEEIYKYFHRATPKLFGKNPDEYAYKHANEFLANATNKVYKYLRYPLGDQLENAFYSKENLLKPDAIRFFQRQFYDASFIQPRFLDDEEKLGQYAKDWKKREPLNYYRIDPLGYIERYEKASPLGAFILILEKIMLFNRRRIANAFLSAVKERMQQNPAYWRPLDPPKKFPLKTYTPPDTDKKRRKLALQMQEKAQSYKTKALTLLTKEYGNLTARRATQRDIDEEKGKNTLIYAFIFQQLAEKIRRDTLEPALYVLQNEEAIDVFFEYSEPILTMKAWDLIGLIEECATAVHESDENEKSGKNQRDPKQYPILEPFEASFLLQFIDKYSKYLVFMNDPTKADGYIGYKTVKIELNDFVGISYLAHLDDLWSAVSLCKKMKGNWIDHLDQNFLAARKLLKMGFTNNEDFQRAKKAIQRMLDSSEYKALYDEVQRAIQERTLLEEAMQGNQNDFFPTPPSLFQEAVLPEIRSWIKGYKSSLPKGTTFRALEPSAGVGTLALEVKSYLRTELYDYTLEMDVVEMFLKACDYLRHLGFNVHCDDFLSFKPSHEYDLIVMNPPFSTEQDIDHVLHAYDMLKKGGLLVAITSSGVVDRSNTNKVKQFQQFLDSISAGVERNPEGSFQRDDAPVKTGVNTVTLTLIKPKRTPNPKKRLGHWTETKFPYLPLSVVDALEPLADALGVSEVARGVKPSSRGDRGFLVAYRDAEGQPSNLGDISVEDGKEDEYWINKREDFNIRHSEQIEQNSRPLWITYRGNYIPSRQHLALAMWAYSPDQKRLLKWMDTNKKALQALKKQKR